MIVKRLECCGIIEINGIGRGGAPNDLLIKALNTAYFTPILHKCGWVVFSQAWRGGTVSLHPYGVTFKDYLEANKLGTVIQLESTLNKNSGNMIDVFLWRVDHEALQKWYHANQPATCAVKMELLGLDASTSAYSINIDQVGLMNPNPAATGNI